jgi:hypothetical protein
VNVVADEARAEQVILALVTERGAEKSICPTEAAQALDGDSWRSQLGLVRRVAKRLASEGRLDILRKGKRVENPTEIKGVIRLRLATPAEPLAGTSQTGLAAGHDQMEPDADDPTPSAMSPPDVDSHED